MCVNLASAISFHLKCSLVFNESGTIGNSFVHWWFFFFMAEVLVIAFPLIRIDFLRFGNPSLIMHLMQFMLYCSAITAWGVIMLDYWCSLCGLDACCPGNMWSVELFMKQCIGDTPFVVDGAFFVQQELKFPSYLLVHSGNDFVLSCPWGGQSLFLMDDFPQTAQHTLRCSCATVMWLSASHFAPLMALEVLGTFSHIQNIFIW